MKKVLAVLAVVLTLVGVCWFPAFAVEAAKPAAAAGFEWSKLFSMLIPLVVPLAIFGLKSIWDKIPKALLPILGPVLGAIADMLLQYSGASTFGPQWGAVLGAAGVGLREIYDQVSGNAKTVSGRL